MAVGVADVEVALAPGRVARCEVRGQAGRHRLHQSELLREVYSFVAQVKDFYRRRAIYHLQNWANQVLPSP